MSRESRIGMFAFIGIVVIGLIGLFLNPIERLRDQYFRVMLSSTMPAASGMKAPSSTQASA